MNALPKSSRGPRRRAGPRLPCALTSLLGAVLVWEVDKHAHVLDIRRMVVHQLRGAGVLPSNFPPAPFSSHGSNEAVVSGAARGSLRGPVPHVGTERSTSSGREPPTGSTKQNTGCSASGSFSKVFDTR